MNLKPFTLRCLFGVVVAVCSWNVGAQTELVGRVVSITDGDTLTLLDGNHVQHKIRLSGIDAPERRQAFGNRSTQALGALAHAKPAVAHCPKKDRYGRWICVVEVAGRDVGLAIVEQGLAWWYRKYAREQSSADRLAYERAEMEARSARRGLWSDSSEPVAPWDWRRAKREKR